MAEPANSTQSQLIDRLADGFAALLQQVEELRRHNEAVEKLLGSEQKILGIVQRKEQRDQDLSISKGVEAWKTLTNDAMDSLRSATGGQNSESTQAGSDYGRPSLPEGHPLVSQKSGKKLVCPFASMSMEKQSERQSNKLSSPMSQRPDSLPTPPETQEQFLDGDALEHRQHEETSPPPSVTGSFSKCPIRMLDERPPEEIAEYFETHKHEIPRSHEICVKRYQSNEQSIRQLDAKYGTLVNMIQGLGMKHQPMLHTRESPEVETKSSGKVEKWADNIKDAPGESETISDVEAGPVAPEEREGHFDRPLKEIRVGESPSRPWGIQVPTNAVHLDDQAGSQSRTPMQERKSRPSLPKNTGIPNKSVLDQEEEKPRMVFTGPVFIGYSPEQAADFIKQSGIGT